MEFVGGGISEPESLSTGEGLATIVIDGVETDDWLVVGLITLLAVSEGKLETLFLEVAEGEGPSEVVFVMESLSSGVLDAVLSLDFVRDFVEVLVIVRELLEVEVTVPSGVSLPESEEESDCVSVQVRSSVAPLLVFVGVSLNE